MRRIAGFLAAAALSATALPAVAASADAVGSRNSANLELKQVFNTPGGTDIEMFSRSLSTYKAASGAMVTAEAPVTRSFAFVGNQTSGAKIYDITDPEAAYLASSIKNCTVGQGDIQVAASGKLATIAFEGGSCKTGTSPSRTLPAGAAIVDLSDVYTPRVIGGAKGDPGGHNNTLHPSGRYLYISGSGIAENESRIPIYDLADPANPKLVQVWRTPGNSPHDIRFSADGKRAYMAGVSQYRIVNTENPESPALISVIVPPGGSIGHDTLVTADKRFLFLGDEAGGGGLFPCPGGAIYAYDLTDERAPLLLGAAEAGGGPVTGRQIDELPGPTNTGGCTSHVMDMNPDGKSLTLGWYVQGTRTFSFASFYNADGTPKVAGNIAAAWGKYGVGLVETGYMIPDGGETWSAKQYKGVPGYIFSNDLEYGLYITKIKG